MADIDRKVEICEASSLPESKEITSNETVGAGENPEIDVGGNKSQDSIISSSRISYENALESASDVSKHGSNLIFQGKSQSREADMQSLGERMTVSEISGESKKMCVKDESSDTYPVVIDDGTNGIESSEPSMTRSSKDGIDKLGSVTAAVFDLNEDINEDGMGEFIQPDAETVSSYSVIKVVAKAGIPRGLPSPLLKFEGGLNWKGSAEMSAFRSVSLSNRFSSKPCSIKRCSPRGFTGIDLNVAAVEEYSSTLQENFCSDVGSKRAKSLGFDLNLLHGDANGLSLNAYTCKGEISKNVHWLGQDHEPLENKTSDHSTNPGKREIDFISRASVTDLSTMQQEPDANHTHSKQYLAAEAAEKNVPQPMELLQRVAPWQPKLPYISCTLPPQNHFLKVPFSQNHVPYIYHPHPQEHGNIVQIINGPSTRNTATSIPTVDAKAKRRIPTSGIRMGEAVPFMFLAGNPTDEHIKTINQETWYATMMKRKEPGGINYYQLGYRQDI